MAVWQVEFAIVPRRALAVKTGVALSNVVDTDWWAVNTLPAGYASKLAAVAPVGASSTTERQMWGEEEGNRVDVWSVNGKPTKMIACVDVRRLDARFGAMLLQFARTADAVLVRRDGVVIEPLVGAFGVALRSSEAWKYASGPAAHIASHKEPPEDDD